MPPRRVMTFVIGTGIPLDLLRRRADIQQAERELAAATARVGARRLEAHLVVRAGCPEPLLHSAPLHHRGVDGHPSSLPSCVLIKRLSARNMLQKRDTI